MIIPRLFTDRQRVSIFFKYDLNSTIVSRSNDNDVFVTSSMRSIFKLTRNSFYQKRSFYNLFPLVELLRNGPGGTTLKAKRANSTEHNGFFKKRHCKIPFCGMCGFYSCFSRFV